MAGGAQWQTEELLILVKTYPQPSSGHRETTCVAAINRDGKMRRVFPVPFRLLEGQFQFKKWEWTRAQLIKEPKDHRPESFKIDVDSIERLETIAARGSWQARRQWLDSHVVASFDELEARRQKTGETLGILRPSRLIGLDITPESKVEWTEAEKQRLLREGLFDSDAVRSRPPLRKLPYAFHYRYECGGATARHRITDWEAGALFWNCLRSHGDDWQQPFRDKMEKWMAQRDLMFLMGTIHRFPDHWLIVGLIYPPLPKDVGQSRLDLG